MTIVLPVSGRGNFGVTQTVLLLEAGPRDRDFWIHVPLGYGKLFARTDVNWAYQSEAEPALNGRRVFTPRGKVLGGSSSINGLVHIRGQRQDYDGWGVPGWGFEDLLPYFKKSEDHDRGASEWHGAGGPIAVSDLPDRHELCDAFIASAMGLGIPQSAAGGLRCELPATGRREQVRDCQADAGDYRRGSERDRGSAALFRRQRLQAGVQALERHHAGPLAGAADSAAGRGERSRQ